MKNSINKFEINEQSLQINGVDLIENKNTNLVPTSKSTYDFIDNKYRSQLLSSTIVESNFIGGEKITPNTGIFGVYGMGQKLNETPLLNTDKPDTSMNEIIRYKYDSDSGHITIGIKIKHYSYYTKYRHIAIYDNDDKLIYELPCNIVDGTSYLIKMQFGYTILSSCELYINPTIVRYIDTNEKNKLSYSYRCDQDESYTERNQFISKEYDIC